MKNNAKTAGYITFLTAVLLMSPVLTTAAEVDFSCMKEQVRPIIQVTDQHQEFDVVVRNNCPGDVYWAMCIERMDPWTHKVIETHNPTGYVQEGKKARVNLHMKNTPRGSLATGRIQEFYANIAYGVKGREMPSCNASACEAKKTDLRAKVSANDSAWAKAENALQAKIAAECPDDGWGSEEVEVCRDKIQQANAEAMAVYADKDRELQASLQAVDPDNCTVYGGGLNTVK